MKPFLSGVAVIAGVAVLTVSASVGDPALWLSQARAAIGGDVAQQSVTSLRIRGSIRRTIGSIATDSSWTMSWQSPDKFVIEQVQGMDMGPMGTRSMTRRNGFNGDGLIRQTTSELPLPPRPPSVIADDVVILNHKHEMARLLMGVLVSPEAVAATYPLLDASAEPALLVPPGGNRMTLAGPDGKSVQLALDAQTHLPAMVSWMGRPVVSFKTTSTGIVSSRGDGVRSTPPGTLPSGDPTAGMPDVEYRMALTEYKVDKGVLWPRRLTTTIGDVPYEVVRINRYEINPTINARTFEVRK